MNEQQCDVLKIVKKNNIKNQRELADITGHSLGSVNKAIKILQDENYLDENMEITKNADVLFEKSKPKNAIILAAGFGMRMVPINLEIPKGLIEINGEPLIERQIKYLHESGINEIYIVVGFMKEQYEYLIDEYNVKLIVCKDYTTKNNLHSLKCVVDKIGNSYIIPCDIWCAKNPFDSEELYSWYMVSDEVDDDSTVRVNRKKELTIVSKGSAGNKMIGISYIDSESAKPIKDKIIAFSEDKKNDNEFWEIALYEKGKMQILAKVVKMEFAIEINTYEQLRELDENSNQLNTDAIDIITEALNVNVEDVVDITVLKKGMTNRSFLFTVKNQRYIMRIPGEGTSELINRREEAQVYSVINKRGICDNIVYMNPDNGYKITEFFENARACDCENEKELELCMKKLRDFHNQKLKVDHEFKIFEQIEFYESLWNGKPSVYRDYENTKKNIMSLESWINSNVQEKVLTHIDAVPDNFLFVRNIDGEEEVRLIDWEYAGMQDPHVDVAMFCIYSMYDKEKVDRLIDIYFEGKCEKQVRIKIYAYVAACGLLWSNWCEYKRQLGVDFGEYSLQQYRYAKDFYRLIENEIR